VGTKALQPPTESDWNIAYTADAARYTMARSRELRRESIECCQRAAALRREAKGLRRAHNSGSASATQVRGMDGCVATASG
jgi:hypothetical protein